MKLYFSPGACSLSPHIILRELGIPFTLAKVDLRAKKVADGEDFLAINPKGSVPVLVAHHGEVLTEGVAIVQYLADLKPELNLAPANGTWERVRLQEALSFISTELHSAMGPLFNPAFSDDAKAIFVEKVVRRLGMVASTLDKQDYFVGKEFSVADAYLFTVLGWTKYFNVDLNQWPSIAKYVALIKNRPAVKAALDAEASA
jgi:glutathione S-transferase